MAAILNLYEYAECLERVCNSLQAKPLSALAEQYGQSLFDAVDFVFDDDNYWFVHSYIKLNTHGDPKEFLAMHSYIYERLQSLIMFYDDSLEWLNDERDLALEQNRQGLSPVRATLLLGRHDPHFKIKCKMFVADLRVLASMQTYGGGHASSRQSLTLPQRHDAESESNEPIDPMSYLTGQALKLFQFLRSKKQYTNFDTLADEHDCWRTRDPATRTIASALERLRVSLVEHQAPWELTISGSERRTKLEKY